MFVWLVLEVFLGVLFRFGTCSGRRHMGRELYGKSNGGRRSLGFVQNGVWGPGGAGEVQQGGRQGQQLHRNPNKRENKVNHATA